MSLPTLEKSWQFSVNQVITTSGVVLTDCQKTIFAIKNSLVSFANNPWTVVRASNAVTADGYDNWLAYTNLNWNTEGSLHSWIVLQQTAIVTGGNPVQLLIDCNGQGNNPPYIQMFVSLNAGFTGGTITTRPTATDEIRIIRPDYNWSPTSAQTHIVSVMESTDGYCTRFFVWSQGDQKLTVYLETMADCSMTNKAAVWANPFSNLAFGDLYSTAYWNCRIGSTAVPAYTGTEVYNNTVVVNANAGAISNITNSYPMTQMTLHSDTVGARGKLGRIYDMWFGSSSIPVGSTFPASPDDKQFVQTKPQVIMPWDGSLPVLT